MHKGVILLIKTEDALDAVAGANSFLERYEGDVWDWYVIGGRWSGELNKVKGEFCKLVKKKFPEEFSGCGVTYNFLENKEYQKVFQEIWEGLGQKTVNPFTRDGYIRYTNRNLITNREDESFLDDCEDDVYVDDVLPLPDCLEIVGEWVQDPIKEGRKLMREASKWLKSGEKFGGQGKNYRMYGHMLINAGNVFAEYFSFDTNVYNVSRDNFSIPEDMTGWYAVMVDMHN